MNKLRVREIEYKTTSIKTRWWALPTSTDIPKRVKYTLHPVQQKETPNTPAYGLMLMSEKVLATLWDTPEEDEAWKDL